MHRHTTDRHQLSLVEKRCAIAAIHHALDSLTFEGKTALGRYAQQRMQWLLEPWPSWPTYLWIYRWLYRQQIDIDGQTLSRRHGAEFLKIALLQSFLRHEPNANRPPASTDLRRFMVRSEILRGIVQSALYSCNYALVINTVQELERLCGDFRRMVAEHDDHSIEISCIEWQIAQTQRETTKLKLDGALMYGLAFAGDGGALTDPSNLRVQIQAVFDALEDASFGRLDRYRIRRQIYQLILKYRDSSPPFAGLEEAARQLRELTPRTTAQFQYDYLLRYAELWVNSSEGMESASRRAARQRGALVLFELAEALRRNSYTDGSDSIIELNARPTRNACRLCLSLAEAILDDTRGQPTEAREALTAALFERAAYYEFHFVGSPSHFQAERAAALIVRASTIRIRSKVARPSPLEVAMQVMKVVERALIHLPNRIQLWMRFYVVRAEIFRDHVEALGMPGPDAEKDAKAADAAKAAYFCDADAKSVKRLAGDRPLWVQRATDVTDSLPAKFMQKKRQ